MLLAVGAFVSLPYPLSPVPATIYQVQRCAIDNLHAIDLSFLEDAAPIEADEFLRRRDRLAATLAATGVDAFVVEPGYTFQ